MRKHKILFESPDLGARYFKEIFLNFEIMTAFCFLFGGLALLPGFVSDEPRLWLIISVSFFVVLVTLNHLIYIVRSKSLQSLILFMEVAYLCMSMLLLLMSLNWLWYKPAFKILVDYKYWIAASVFLSVLYGIYWGLKYWPRNIKNTMNYIRNSGISSGELYYSLFKLPNVDAVARGRYNHLIGIASVLGIISAHTFGREGHVLLLATVVLMAVFSAGYASMLVRRIYFQKYLGRWDVEIYDLKRSNIFNAESLNAKLARAMALLQIKTVRSAWVAFAGSSILIVWGLYFPVRDIMTSPGDTVFEVPLDVIIIWLGISGTYFSIASWALFSGSGRRSLHEQEQIPIRGNRTIGWFIRFFLACYAAAFASMVLIAILASLLIGFRGFEAMFGEHFLISLLLMGIVWAPIIYRYLK